MKYQVSDRVVVNIQDLEPWNRAVANELQGKVGTIMKIQEGYDFPCRGTGVGLGIPGHLVEFDEVLTKSDGRPFQSFWLLPCDIQMCQGAT